MNLFEPQWRWDSTGGSRPGERRKREKKPTNQPTNQRGPCDGVPCLPDCRPPSLSAHLEVPTPTHAQKDSSLARPLADLYRDHCGWPSSGHRRSDPSAAIYRPGLKASLVPNPHSSSIGPVCQRVPLLFGVGPRRRRRRSAGAGACASVWAFVWAS